MPTGYTADLCNGNVPFNDFVLGCASAFAGEQCGNPPGIILAIPKQQLNAAERAKDAAARLNELEMMTADEKVALGRELIASQIENVNKIITEKQTTGTRLDAMRSAVQSWNPEDEYRPLRDFMISQINMTVDIDGDATSYINRLEELQSLHPMSAYQNEVESVQWAAQYYTKEASKEAVNRERLTGWVKGLYQALNLPAPE